MATKELGKTGITGTADLGDNSFAVKKVESWSRLSLELPNFDWAEDFVKFIEEVQKILGIVVALMEAALDFFLGLIEDNYIKLIRALIEALKKLIEGFLDDLGLYLLFVPLRKRFMTTFMGLGDVAPKAAGPLFQTNMTDWPAVDEDDPEAVKRRKEFLTELNRYSGGNYGFYATIMESLYDKGDIHRPQFDNKDDYVGGMVWVMGTALDPFGLLDDIWRLFGLFGNLAKNTVSPTMPIPSGLTARAITYPTDTVHKAGFLLEWDTPPLPFSTIIPLGNIRYEVTRYAIIMSKNEPGAVSAQNVVDLLGTRSLQKDLVNSSKTIKVIEEAKFKYTTSAYVVKGVEATKDDSFCFHVAWKCSLFEDPDQDWKDKLKHNEKEVEKPQDYWYVSNAAYVTPYPTLPASTPPDWVRTPSIAEIFPQLGYFLRLMLAQIEKLLDKLIAPADMIKQFVEMLKREVEKYAALVNSILEQIKKLAELLNLPKNVGGIYCRKFFGKGGNAFFLSDLANSLSPSYPNAPPYTRGDEYVLGVVWLCGGPKLAVESTMAILNLLFPNAGEPEDLLMSLGGGIAGLETQYFGGDMQSGDEPPTFDENLCEITKGSKVDSDAFVPDNPFTWDDTFNPTWEV
jgi:hypothetical protein